MEMITESELRIMAGFFPEGSSVTIKEIEKASGYSYERVYSTLMDLQKKRIVEGKKVGRTWSFNLDQQSNAKTGPDRTGL